MKHLELAGARVPALGQGTWFLGDDRTTRETEIEALRTGLDLGLTVIDTAEMYGDGRSEELVGEAIAGRRDEVFLVGKVLPGHASASGTVAACRASLERLGTDRLDLYLLHWPGPHPLEETVAGFESLVAEGLIGAWGVSNFDTDDLAQLPAGAVPAADQVLYNPARRGPEHGLLPALRRDGVVPMAYSPIEQGRLLGDAVLREIAHGRGATPAQVALAWVLRDGDVLAIPKAANPDHTRLNAAAAALELAPEELAAIDARFPLPAPGAPLEML